MAKIAIVGNGPARELYDGFDGDVCICNIPQIDVPYDYLSIIDRKAFDYIKKLELSFDKPVLTTDEMYKQIGNKLPMTLDPVFEKKLMNSAATAAYYFSDKYDEIWLYGCNALWSDVTRSHQDTLIPRPTRNVRLHLQWREHWKKVWATNASFYIVCPPNAEVQDYGKNVCWYSKSP